MKDLSQYTDEELLKEIEKRDALRLLKPQPLRLEDINVGPIIDEAIAHIEGIWGGKIHEDNDDAQYMFETVMRTLYGPDIFKKIQNFYKQSRK